MSLFDYLSNKTEFIPVREMEKILWNDNQYINCRANDEPLGITSTVDNIVLEISDYKPYKGKYRQCKSYYC